MRSATAYENTRATTVEQRWGPQPGDAGVWRSGRLSACTTEGGRDPRHAVGGVGGVSPHTVQSDDARVTSTGDSSGTGINRNTGSNDTTNSTKGTSGTSAQIQRCTVEHIVEAEAAANGLTLFQNEAQRYLAKRLREHSTAIGGAGGAQSPIETDLEREGSHRRERKHGRKQEADPIQSGDQVLPTTRRRDEAATDAHEMGQQTPLLSQGLHGGVSELEILADRTPGHLLPSGEGGGVRSSLQLLRVVGRDSVRVLVANDQGGRTARGTSYSRDEMQIENPQYHCGGGITWTSNSAVDVARAAACVRAATASPGTRPDASLLSGDTHGGHDEARDGLLGISTGQVDGFCVSSHPIFTGENYEADPTVFATYTGDDDTGTETHSAPRTTASASVRWQPSTAPSFYQQQRGCRSSARTDPWCPPAGKPRVGSPLSPTGWPATHGTERCQHSNVDASLQTLHRSAAPTLSWLRQIDVPSSQGTLRVGRHQDHRRSQTSIGVGVDDSIEPFCAVPVQALEAETGAGAEPHLTWKRYKLKPPPEWKTWPPHAKKVPLLNLEKILTDMTAIERAEFDSFYDAFRPKVLGGLIKQTVTEIHLTKTELDVYIEIGQYGPPSDKNGPFQEGLGMILFFEPEIGKVRKRLIEHTIDINAQTTANATSFQSQQQQIEEGVWGWGFCADSKWFYAQIPIPSESEPFYMFYTPTHGWLTKRSVATGQRQSVGAAQSISKFLDRRCTDFMRLLGSGLVSYQSQYIDNFRRREETPTLASAAAKTLVRVCQHYNVTLNETLDDLMKQTIRQEPYDFIGVRYYPMLDAVGLPDKTVKKLKQLEQDIVELERGTGWSVEFADSVFGLLIHASCIMKLQTAAYYYVYKFYRRRHRACSKGELKQKDDIDVWPSIVRDMHQWCRDLLTLKTRRVHIVSNEAPILITDASLKGFGATLFFPQESRVQYLAGPWPERFDTDFPGAINELETLAVLFAARHFQLSTFHLILDNTTALHAIRKGRSTNFHISRIVASLSDYAILSTQYVHTSEMISDSLSRIYQSPEHQEKWSTDVRLAQLRRDDRSGLGEAEAAISESHQAGWYNPYCQ